MKRILVVAWVIWIIFISVFLLNAILAKNVFSQQKSPETRPPESLKESPPQLLEYKEGEILKSGKDVKKTGKGQGIEPRPPGKPDGPVPILPQCKEDEVLVDEKCVKRKK
ncbi:MAG: hypothetical protein ABSH06_14975 [Thermodesulfobacteriota bacterium]